MSSINDVQSASDCLFSGKWRPLVSVITPLYCVAIIFQSASVVLHVFSVLCAYPKFGHHPHQQATFVPNFISFTTFIATLAHREKSHTQSLTHSPSLFDAPGTKRLHFGKCQKYSIQNIWKQRHVKTLPKQILKTKAYTVASGTELCSTRSCSMLVILSQAAKWWRSWNSATLKHKQTTDCILELGNSSNTNLIQFTFDPIWFTGALLICYIAHRPLIQYSIYELWKCEVDYSQVY